MSTSSTARALGQHAGRDHSWLVASIVGVLTLCATLFMWSRVLTSQGLYLHISVGHWILQHHAVPDHGIFSGSRPDAPWLAHEWLASLAIAGLFETVSWNWLLVGKEGGLGTAGG